MRKLLFSLLFIGSAHASPVSLDLHQISLAELSRLVYGEILKRSFVLDAAILDHQPQVTVSFKRISTNQIADELNNLLDLHGFASETIGGLTRITKKRDKPNEEQVHVYRPLHRPVQYLLDLVSSLFPPGAFTTQGRASNIGFNQLQGQGTPGASAAMPNSPNINQGMNQITKPDVDVLVFKGSPQNIQRLDSILAQLDKPSGELLVKAVVYEVQSNRKDGSAVDLAVSILSGKLGLKMASGITPGSQNAAMRLVTGPMDISAIYSAISSDDRFKQLTSPRLRVRSGGSAKFSVGNQTPVLGSVTYDNQGKAIQSVEYKPSGVIFELKPEVHDKSVVLDVKQQISQFVPTTTGVNTTPTLNTRELSTQVSATSGEIILIGGLDDDRQSSSDSGLSFMPKFLRSQQDEATKTEIVLMLQLDQI